MKIISSAEVEKVLNDFPNSVTQSLSTLRDLIIESAKDTGTISQLEETIKWGEAAFIAPQGSTIRLGWKPAKPEHVAIYFNCNSRLVETFKELYANELLFEGKRAIMVPMNKPLPKSILKHCLQLALIYHQRKHLPLLGA